MVGQVGSDTNADFVLGQLRKAGVDCSTVRRMEGPTGTAVVFLEPNGAPARALSSLRL